MIASLPMYNQHDCLPALDTYWALIRDGLRASGMSAPDALAWDMPDFMDHWLRPDLILSQTCGYPFRAVLHGKVTLVGTPDFGVEGCAPGYYRSVFIVRAGDPRTDLTAFQRARFAYNDALSQSGWAAPQNHASGFGFQFRNLVHSEGHASSARAVLNGRADIASLDAVTWRHLQRNDAALSGLRVLDQTAPTPGLPYIAALGVDPGRVFAAVEAAIHGLASTDRATLGFCALVEIPADVYLAVQNPAPPDQFVY